MILLIILLFFLLLAIRIPIAFVLGLVSVCYILMVDLPLVLVAQRSFVQLNNFIFLAIPCFMLTGALMNAGGMTRRLVKFVQLLLGRVRGSLAVVNIAASMLFAGITGSAAADTSAIGGIMIPAMIKDGYSPSESAAITAASSTIGPIIPPSILFVVYGVVSGVSIGSLFIAGIIPGLLSGFAMIILVMYFAKKYNWKSKPAANSLSELFKGAIDAILSLIAPVIIIGGILSGLVTPTEASVIAVVYAFICSAFILKELKLKDLPKIFIDTIILSGSVMLIVAMAGIFGWILTRERVPLLMAEAIFSVTTDRTLILIFINLILLFAGTFLDTNSSTIIFTPILLPIAVQLGINPIHFGVILVFNLCIGLVTPPVGTCLYIACSIAKIKLEQLVVAIFPYLIVLIVVLLVITYSSGLVMFLPNLLLK